MIQYNSNFKNNLTEKSDIKIDFESAKESTERKKKSIRILKSRNKIDTDKVKQSIEDLEEVTNYNQKPIRFL